MQNERLGRADFHMHTNYSDGLPTPKELLDFVAQHRPGLDVIAITDHDCLDGSLWAYQQRDKYPFDIIPGVEISSIEGDVLGLWVTQPIPVGMSLAETAAAVHEQGGIAILAHPFHFYVPIVARNFMRYLRRPQGLLESGIDALETLNASTISPASNRLARRLHRQIGLAQTGSSDAHSPGAIGTGTTRFAGRTGDDLRAALLQRTTVAEGGMWPLREICIAVATIVHRNLNRYSGAKLHSAQPKEIMS